MIVNLSHTLSTHEPNWPGAPGLVVRPMHQMAAGDIADTHVVEIYTHYGTHCDVPAHFIPGARTIDGFTIDDFIFHAPLLLELELSDDELVREAHLEPHMSEISRADLLLLRSGFEQHRSDHARYVEHGPGFTDGAARLLREHAPGLRGLAIDWLSMSAISHVDEGVDAHRTLLEDRDGSVVLIFEDVALSRVSGRLTDVWAVPLFIEGLDGFPCTIIAAVS